MAVLYDFKKYLRLQRAAERLQESADEALSIGVISAQRFMEEKKRILSLREGSYSCRFETDEEVLEKLLLAAKKLGW